MTTQDEVNKIIRETKGDPCSGCGYPIYKSETDKAKRERGGDSYDKAVHDQIEQLLGSPEATGLFEAERHEAGFEMHREARGEAHITDSDILTVLRGWVELDEN